MFKDFGCLVYLGVCIKLEYVYLLADDVHMPCGRNTLTRREERMATACGPDAHGVSDTCPRRVEHMPTLCWTAIWTLVAVII